MTDPPLIMTAQLQPAWQRAFQDLRNQYFPPDRNIVPAHISLFHALPADRLNAMQATLEQLAGAADLPCVIDDIYSLGGGVAFRVNAPLLVQFRETVRERIGATLTPQDRQRFRPHITVQNKVSRETAQSALSYLRQDFTPITTSVATINLWRYEGGPWTLLKDYAVGSP